MKITLIACVVVLALGLLAAPLAAVGAELAVAPGYRAEVIVSGLSYLHSTHPLMSRGRDTRDR